MNDSEVIFAKAREEQRLMAPQVISKDIPLDGENLVTGFDVSYSDSEAFACAVTMDFSSMQVVRTEKAVGRCEIPYVSGLFYLREGPIAIDTLKRLGDMGHILIDGNGVLHPRRCGLACYIGIKLDQPTIGVAKTLLMGQIGPRSGDLAEVRVGKEILGAALWLSGSDRPVYISVGHKVSLETAIQIVRDSSKSTYPEVLRLADSCSRFEREMQESK
ncbi:MAG: endonuclease V [Candidatus Hodarchaeota archaeon]